MTAATITISEAAKRLGVHRQSVTAVIDVLGLPTEDSPYGNARLISPETLETLERKFANRATRGRKPAKAAV